MKCPYCRKDMADDSSWIYSNPEKKQLTAEFYCETCGKEFFGILNEFTDEIPVDLTDEIWGG